MRFEDTSNYAPQAPARALRISLCLYLVLVLIECTILRDLNGDLPLSPPHPATYAAAQFIQYTAGKGKGRSSGVRVKETAKFFKPNKMLKATHTKNICKRVEMRRQPVMVQGKQQQLEMGEVFREKVNISYQFISIHLIQTL